MLKDLTPVRPFLRTIVEVLNFLKLVLTSQFMGQFLGWFWKQFLWVYFQTVELWVFVKWLIDWLILLQTIVWWCFIVKLGSRLSCKFVFIAGFQPESNRQWNETNLALLKPLLLTLERGKSSREFLTTPTISIRILLKSRSIEKGDGTRKFLLC